MPRVFDVNVILRERPSLKPLYVAGTALFDRHVSPSAYAECCCSSSKQIKMLGMMVERLEQRLNELMRNSGYSSPVYRHIRGEMNNINDAVWFTEAPKKSMSSLSAREKKRQKISTLTMPVELQKDALGGIRVLRESQMLANMGASVLFGQSVTCLK
ncbi:hypothetical protein DPMN_116197 [Dreissena polymorpha]|uniref:Uncharacterized protein n=1 Tax=Dreissena polymorpha TaxID=45954 RepID=A0A9D4KMN8_DREPO|nr:hypothetical protein DPMN_116197 [Dreissena polymorpha]